MLLERLWLHRFRNIESMELDFRKGLNWFVGDNGVGKTSIVEAIYTLSSGKSFRTSTGQDMIMSGEVQSVVKARLVNENLGGRAETIQLVFTQGGLRASLNQIPVSLNELATGHPICVLFPGSEGIIGGPPMLRRRVADWIGFYTIRDFWSIWRSYGRLLRQRNEILKEGDQQWLAAIDSQFVDVAMQLTDCRRDAIERILPHVREIVAELNGGVRVAMSYRQGWPREYQLREVLKSHLESDLRRGFTSVGPHRDDIDVLLNGIPASKVASRGQIKLIVYGVVVGQVRMLSSENGLRPIVVVDELGAELDAQRTKAVVAMLSCLEVQVFVTFNGVLGNLPVAASNVFHVERGGVSKLV